MEPLIYRRLIGPGAPSTAAHLLASTISDRCAEFGGPLPDLVGLSTVDMDRAMTRHFPAAAARWERGTCLRAALRRAAGLDVPENGAVWDGGTAVDREIEADLRGLLLDHRSQGRTEEKWFAAIVARACARPNHLWQDLGLAGRGDLNRLMNEYFAPLAAKNTGDMKWKKFFYRQLCEREGLVACRAPVCSACTDYQLCFGPEN